MGLLEEAVTLLEAEGWPVHAVEDGTVITTAYRGTHGDWLCFVQVETADEQILCYSLCPVRPPQEVLAAVTEFLTRANFGLRAGNFEIDLADGETRFKSTLELSGAGLDAALFRRLLKANVQHMDKYLPGIEAVAAAERTPVEAIAIVEG